MTISPHRIAVTSFSLSSRSLSLSLSTPPQLGLFYLDYHSSEYILSMVTNGTVAVATLSDCSIMLYNCRIVAVINQIASAHSGPISGI